MAVNVLIPTPLRNLTADLDTVQAEASTVNELIAALEASYPGMGNRLSDDSGNLRRFINIYVNGEDIRFLESGATTLKDGDEVSIVPAIAGGALERWILTFNSQMYSKPIINELGTKFNLVVNIERANVSEGAGWMQVTLSGETEEIQRGVGYLNTLGVFVRPTELAGVN